MSTTEEKAPVVRRGPARAPRLRLVYSGDVLVPPSTFVVSHGETPIGRDVPAGVRLAQDGRASRLHATLHRGALGMLRIVDEKSRNGTYVNGRRVEEASLADGDVLSVGDSHFVVRLEPEDLGDAPVPALVGTAPCMRALRRAIHEVAPTRATVSILGESGCGKEVVARALHDLGRPQGPFVAVNCSAIPETLAESQLFGHVAGAFTGAVARPGLFRAAHGGTLFLDEIGDLPPALQPKLLRAIEDHAVLPVGATSPIACDVRIVAATNRDLRAAVEGGAFRGDLFARISTFLLEIPPLRARREDILELLLHALGAPRRRLSSALAEALLLHPWPFNVREVLALAAQLRIRGGSADVLDLDLVEGRLTPAPAATGDTDEDDEREEAAAEKEPPPGRVELEALLQKHRGVVADVARVMRRSRKQVYRWITEHGVDVRRFRG
ncbi:sigma 54-interacting transcriptional regulator [Polyangium spumosum]|nr:sigma 54-interacting transcriptional regulator [Polyangium spumosum]